MRRCGRRRLTAAAILSGLIAIGCHQGQHAEHMAGISVEGLAGYWRLDEGSGDVARDRSGHGRDGAIHNGEWVRAPFGNALRFNGEDSYVTIPAMPELKDSDELMVGAWVFWEGTGRYPNIVTGVPWNPGGFMIFVCDDQCTFRMGKPGPAPWEVGKTWEETAAQALRPLELGRWYHIAATFKRPNITTYLNGEPVGAATWNYRVGHSGKLLIGTWDEMGLGPTMSHHGLIGEVMICRRALGPSEIKAVYQFEAARRQ